jgi:hypothetical protein
MKKTLLAFAVAGLAACSKSQPAPAASAPAPSGGVTGYTENLKNDVGAANSAAAAANKANAQTPTSVPED